MIGKKFYYITAAVAATIALGWGGIAFSAMYKADVCRTQTKEAASNFAEEWDDVMARAKESNRLNMQANVSDLQSVKRRVGDAKWPECSRVAEKALLVAMESDVSQLLKFTGGGDIAYVKSFAWEVSKKELASITDHGKSEHLVDSEEAAKESVRVLLNTETDRLSRELEPLNRYYAEYEQQYEQVDQQIETVPEVDVSADFTSYLAMSEQRRSELDQLHEERLALNNQYEDVIQRRSELQEQKNAIKSDLSLL